ncbi:MAG: helix-turn-helix domain-containing protein [Aureispira sp.]
MNDLIKYLRKKFDFIGSIILGGYQISYSSNPEQKCTDVQYFIGCHMEKALLDIVTGKEKKSKIQGIVDFKKNQFPYLTGEVLNGPPRTMANRHCPTAVSLSISGKQKKKHMKIKSLKPNELLELYMNFGSKRNDIFKKNYDIFYISRLQDLREISKPPVLPVKAKTHSLLFLTSKILNMNVGSYPIRVGQNECVIIPAGQVFSYSNDDFIESEDAEGFICGFNNDFLIGQIGSRDLLKTFEFLTIWGNPTIKPKEKSAIHQIYTLNRIWNEYTENALQNQKIIQAYLLALLCDLNIDYLPLSSHKNKTAVELTNKFKELLHQNIGNSHKVSDFANMLNISPNHLNKNIKLITQKSPSVWIRETLINEAKVLLFQSDLSIQEIASELGIDDQSYFARLFKKQEGVTPASYRKMIDLS